MTFDWTLNIGAIIQIIALLGGSIGIYASWKIHATVTDMRLAALNTSFEGLRQELQPLPKAVIELAVQNERFKSMDMRITALEKKTESME